MNAMPATGITRATHRAARRARDLMPTASPGASSRRPGPPTLRRTRGFPVGFGAGHNPPREVHDSFTPWPEPRLRTRPSDGRRRRMRRTLFIGLTLVAIAVGVLIGVSAYHAGYTNGLTAAAGEGGRIVQVVGPRYGPPFGFFPGFLLFPLFIIGFFLLIRGLAWRRWGGPAWGHHHGYGDGPGGRGAMFEDWHRRQHEQSAGEGTTRGEPASV